MYLYSVRKKKERYAQSEMRKQANRMTFGEVKLDKLLYLFIKVQNLYTSGVIRRECILAALVDCISHPIM